MHARSHCIAVLAAAFAFSCAAKKPAAPAPPPFDAALAAQMDAAIAANFVMPGPNGLVVTVLRKDGSSHTSTAGMADEATQRPVAPGDVFRVGSITKTFVSSIILQLRDEGTLSIDDTLDHWVPGFNLGPLVTLRTLLNHTSGVYNFTNDPAFLNQSATPATPQYIINFALSHGSDFTPGTQWEYSNTNYFLLGLVVEAATGMNVTAEFPDRLLIPLNLTDVWFEGVKGPTATGYLYQGPMLPFDMSWTWTAGGMDASTPGLCQWATTLYATDKVLPAATLAEMLTDTVLPNGSKTGYGLGVFLDTRGGRAVVGHTGSTMGFQAEVYYDQATGDCVSGAVNDFFYSPESATQAVWQLLPLSPG